MCAGSARKPRLQSPCWIYVRQPALDGFLAFALDALAPFSRYPGDGDKARNLFAKLNQNETRNDSPTGKRFLKAMPVSYGRAGVVVFCYPGVIANLIATWMPDLGAAVPFYGGQPNAEEAAKIKTCLPLQGAETDDRINAGWPVSNAALKAAGARYMMYQYPKTRHRFHNDTAPRHDVAVAKLARQRAAAFSKKKQA